jgi:hypothetical protein
MNYGTARAVLSEHVCNLKKHKGELWSAVFDADEDYCRWAYYNVEDLDEDVREAFARLFDE